MRSRFSSGFNVSVACLVLIAINVANAQAPVQKIMCAMPQPQASQFLVVVHAVSLYNSLYPAVQWRVKLIGGAEKETPTSTLPTSTRRTTALGYMLNGTDCDAMVGPLYSYLSIVVGPLVTVPWMDGGTSSSQLSDKSVFGTFTRTSVTDLVTPRSLLPVAKAFGWTMMNVLCIDEAYGQSVAQGFSAAFLASGGVIESSQCIAQDASYNVALAALRGLQARQSRVVFVGGTGNSAGLGTFVRTVNDTQAFRDMVFLFPAGVCAGLVNWQLDVPGSICYNFAWNETQFAPFRQYYSTVDNSAIQAQLIQDHSWLPSQTTDPNYFRGLGSYHAFFLDAVTHMMSSFDHVQRNGLGRYSSMVEFRKNWVTEGVTGTVRLNPTTGDRTACFFNMYLALPGRVSVVLGYSVDGRFVQTHPQTYIMGKYYSPGDALPSTIKTAAVAQVDLTGMIVGVVLGTLALVVIAVVVMLAVMPKTRDNSAAPKDGDLPFAMVFTDIQSSTSLWARAPEQMSEGVEAHHMILRKQVQKYKGYEVKTIGDSFMVAFTNVDDAINFAVNIQLALFDYDWGTTAFDDVYAQLRDEAADAGIIKTAAADASVWKGIRVRAGIHFGSGSIKFDPVALSYDYYGTMVNTAARVEGVGNGGQVLLTEAGLKAVSPSFRKKMDSEMAMTNLGPQPLRGLDDLVTLYQLSPKRLGARTFADLRLDVEKVVDEEDGDEKPGNETSTVSSNQTHSFTDPGMQNLMDYTKSLFAPLKVDQRVKALKTLCDGWRVPVDGKKLEQPKTMREVLKLLTNRVSGAAAEERAVRMRHAVADTQKPPQAQDHTPREPGSNYTTTA